MRVGTRVKAFLRYVDGEPELSDVTGTVIKAEGDCYLYEDVPCVLTVRWDDGRLEDIEFTDNQQPRLEDVTPCLYVNVYLMTREYGGPEEGGWHFTRMTPLPDLCKITANQANALEQFDQLSLWATSQNATRPPLSSVLSNGIYVVQREAFPATESPAYKPVYQ